jgi:hypothetical protein
MADVAFDLAAERAVQLALAGEASADALVDALGAAAVDARHVSSRAKYLMAGGDDLRPCLTDESDGHHHDRARDALH